MSGINFMRYAQSRKIGKPSNLKVCENKQTKEHKQDSQNWIMIPMPGGEDKP